MTEDDNISLDINVGSVSDTVEESARRLDKINQDEVISFDITLVNSQGKARVGVNAPLSVGSEAADYIHEHVEGIVNKEMSTDTGVKIGEMMISGDETIEGVQIENKYKKEK